MIALSAKLYQKKASPKVWATQVLAPSDVLELADQLKLSADGVTYWIHGLVDSFTARVDYSLEGKSVRWLLSEGDFVVFNEDGVIDQIAASDEFLDEWEQR